MKIVKWVAAALAVSMAGYGCWRHPPVQTLGTGEVGVRTNLASGQSRPFGEGPVLLVPGLHELRRYSLRDRVHRDPHSVLANGAAPFQSSEGLPLGVDLTVRYAIDREALQAVAARLPDDLDGLIVEPMLRGIAHRTFSQHTVKEIYSTKRAEIQAAIEQALGPRLKDDGLLLRGVHMGRVDLPSEYRAGMERMLAQELETEQMEHTLLLRDQQVRQAALEGEAEKVRREKIAEASAREQVIAAKAQADAMKHVIAYKQKQIEQRRLEADADKLQRVRNAEAAAEARRIEAAGEADSRRKLAEVEVFRAEGLARVASEQVEREGASLSRHPLIVQKTMAEKLSDKISVIVVPPGTDGEIIDAALLGRVRR